MKERPILFSAPMVRAILEGRKTQTRRVVKPKAAELIQTVVDYNGHFTWDTMDWDLRPLCPFGQAGDRLYVRESAKVQWVKSGLREAGIKYMADGVEAVVHYPSRLAPAPVGKLLANGTYREASRILLEITAVRVERLKVISEEDAKAEGCDNSKSEAAILVGWFETPKRAFWRLWESINGPGSWEKNPWVWVVEFKRVQP